MRTVHELKKLVFNDRNTYNKVNIDNDAVDNSIFKWKAFSEKLSRFPGKIRKRGACPLTILRRKYSTHYTVLMTYMHAQLKVYLCAISVLFY